jgi:hypothetical protein
MTDIDMRAIREDADHATQMLGEVLALLVVVAMACLAGGLWWLA